MVMVRIAPMGPIERVKVVHQMPPIFLVEEFLKGGHRSATLAHFPEDLPLAHLTHHVGVGEIGGLYGEPVYSRAPHTQSGTNGWRY